MANVRVTGFINEGGVTKVTTAGSGDRLICESGLETMDIVPSSDSTFNIGDPNTNVYSNVFSINGNFQVVSMANNGGDPTAEEGFGYIYTKDNGGSTEVFVQDDKGNVTQISPHNEDNEWHYFSRNMKTGKVVRINMEKMIRRLEEITGESFIEEWIEE